MLARPSSPKFTPKYLNGSEIFITGNNKQEVKARCLTP